MISRRLQLAGLVQQAFFQSISDQLSDRVNIKLGHQPGAMIVDRFGAHTQTLRYFGIIVSVGNQMQNLAFARRQRSRFGLLFQCGKRVLGNIGAAVQDNLETLAHFIRRVRLQKQPINLCSYPIGKMSLGGEAGDDNDARLRAPAPDFDVNLHALGKGHACIKGKQCRLQFLGQRNRFQAVFRLTHNFDVRIFFEDRAQTVTNNRVIIRDHSVMWANRQ